MPQVDITIGGRTFDVACQDGEEEFVITAAAMLDVEASSLSTQIGRMPESRMLLMAGLLLADRTAGLEDKVRETEAKLAEVQAALTEQTAQAAEPAIDADITGRLSKLAQKAEEIAERVAG